MQGNTQAEYRKNHDLGSHRHAIPDGRGCHRFQHTHFSGLAHK